MEGGIQGRIAGRFAAEWVEAGAEVAVNAVGIDERHGGGHVGEVLSRCRGRLRDCRGLGRRALGLRGFGWIVEIGTQRLEDFGVEGMASGERCLDTRQERPGLCYLDAA